MPRAFITGSRVYGTPREESDVDLVILIDKSELGILWSMANEKEQDDQTSGNGPDADLSIKFGKLNLICVSDESLFDAWKTGTELLKKEKPVTRERAVSILSHACQEARGSNA